MAAPSGGGVVRLGDGSALVVADVTASDGPAVASGRLYAGPGPGRSAIVRGGWFASAGRGGCRSDRRSRHPRPGRRCQWRLHCCARPARRQGAEPIVCCRGSDGAPVSRPPAAGHPGPPVEDADVACPACGAIDFEEYLPFEAGSSGPTDSEGKIVPQAVVRCRVCGHQEREAIVLRAPDPPDSRAPALARDQRMAKADSMRREIMWRSIEEGVEDPGLPDLRRRWLALESLRADQRTTAG